MKISLFKNLALLGSLFCMSLCAEGEIRDPSTGVTFPATVNFQHEGKDYILKATGAATRKKFFVKVYSVANYVQDGVESLKGDKFQDILQSNKAKQLTLKWVHEASAEKIQDGYRESFNNTLADAQKGQLQNDINTFVSFFNTEAKKGDEHILRWVPPAYVEVVINGNKAGSINNPEFAKALWSLWFGPKSVVDREKLLTITN